MDFDVVQAHTCTEMASSTRESERAFSKHDDMSVDPSSRVALPLSLPQPGAFREWGASLNAIFS